MSLAVPNQTAESDAAVLSLSSHVKNPSSNVTWMAGDLWTWHWLELILLPAELVFGVAGNSLVLVVTVFTSKMSTTRLVVRLLATLDLTAVVVVNPLVLVTLIQPDSGGVNAICAVTAFVAVWTAGSADCVLLIIASDRFMKLYMKRTRGMSSELIKKLAASAVVGMAFINIPVLWIFGKNTKYFPEEEVKITHCFMKTRSLSMTIVKIYFVVIVSFFFLSLAVLFTLYCKIIRRMQQHLTVACRLHITSVPGRGSTKVMATREAMKRSIVVFVVVTIAYFIDNALYIVLVAAHVYEETMDDNRRGYHIVFDLANHCPVVSHLVNPVIYSFTSRSFRQEVRDLFSCGRGLKEYKPRETEATVDYTSAL